MKMIINSRVKLSLTKLLHRIQGWSTAVEDIYLQTNNIINLQYRYMYDVYKQNKIKTKTGVYKFILHIDNYNAKCTWLQNIQPCIHIMLNVENYLVK